MRAAEITSKHNEWNYVNDGMGKVTHYQLLSDELRAYKKFSKGIKSAIELKKRNECFKGTYLSTFPTQP